MSGKTRLQSGAMRGSRWNIMNRFVWTTRALLSLVAGIVVFSSSYGQGTSRALIVGVSRYSQLSQASQLEFADDDAQAFYDFILSKSAGNFNRDNVKLLLNQKATAAEIYAGLDWLVDETKEGDRVIIYFSGHGDIERKTVRQRGFLLAHDSPPVGYNVGGTIDVSYLQDYVATITDKKAKVILITDACRSGKLAGGREGAVNTTKALQEEWANTIKVLSSQSEEPSKESMQWGDGHGIFTYSLLNGMWGMADKNGDQLVSLGELELYLKEEIPAATNYTQYPVVIGEPRTFLSKVDSSRVAAIKAKKSSGVELMGALASKGDIGKLDPAAAKIRMEFDRAIASRNLIARGGSAYHYFKQFSKTGKQYPGEMNEMKRVLLAKLEDDAQTVLNQYMKQELQVSAGTNIVAADEARFVQAGMELDSALTLMSAENTRYNRTFSRSLFLKVNVLGCTCSPNDISRSKARSSLLDLKKAIALDPDAAYLYNSLGSSYFYLNQYDSAIVHYAKSAELAPSWTYPLVNLGTAYVKKGELEKSIRIYKESIKKDPNDSHSYLMIYRAWIDLYKHAARDTFLTYVKSIIKTTPTESAYQWLGDIASWDNRFMDAAEYWNVALGAGKSPGILTAPDQAAMLFSAKEYDAALVHYNKILEVLHNNTKLLWPYRVKSEGKRNNKGEIHYVEKERGFDRWEYDPDTAYYILQNTDGWSKEYMSAKTLFSYEDTLGINARLHTAEGWDSGMPYTLDAGGVASGSLEKLTRSSIFLGLSFKNLSKIYEAQKDEGRMCFYKACSYWWQHDEHKALDWMKKALSKGYRPTGNEPEVELLGMEGHRFTGLLDKYDIKLR